MTFYLEKRFGQLSVANVANFRSLFKFELLRLSFFFYTIISYATITVMITNNFTSIPRHVLSFKNPHLILRDFSTEIFRTVTDRAMKIC